jgi:selenoprotein W-related protein
VTDEIMTHYQHIIEQFTLITGSKGVFDLKVNDTLLFSKKALGRHAEPGEILQLFTELVGPGVERYPRE